MIEAALAVTVILILIGATEWADMQRMKKMLSPPPDTRLPLERMIDSLPKRLGP